MFQITSDGQICDDSASESETESEDEEKFEDETPWVGKNFKFA